MKPRHVLIFGAVLVLLVTMGLAQKGKPIHWTVTGSNHFLGSDGDIDEGNMGICGGKGTFGQHTCNTFFTAGPHPSPPAPDCYAQLTTFTHVQRFTTGDMLYSRIPDVPLGDNYICFSADGWTGTVTVEFFGGTGRFEGASGSATWVFDGDFLGNGFGAAIDEIDGVIYLNGD
ncbi:MAG: hypothetical protein ACWGQW_17015 [bacterium]